MFRRPIRHQRCVVVATAYYEWSQTPGGKQPYCIRAQGDALLLMAGIFEGGACAILTCPARDDMAFIHDRMPVLLPRLMLEDYVGRYDMVQVAIKAAEQVPLHWHRVTRKVGNPRFDGPQCMMLKEL